MESLDTLRLGVEASIAFAGFAGIVATFQFGGSKKVSRIGVFGLTIILQFSLIAALVSSVPLLLHSFGAKNSTLWALSSAVVVIVLAAAGYLQGAVAAKSVKNIKFYREFLLIQCITILMILMNLLNVLDYFFHRGPGPVIATVLWGLCIAGVSFSRLLLLPLWRRVREQDAAEMENTA